MNKKVTKKAKQTGGEYLRNRSLINKTITEHDLQVSVFEEFELLSRNEIPELKLAFAIPNGGFRGWNAGKKLKAEGVKRGVPDIFIPVSRNNYHGLFIEMKRSDGKESPEQTQYIKSLIEQGYFAYTCYAAQEAIDLTKTYFGVKKCQNPN